jgi:hypothetical protein
MTEVSFAQKYFTLRRHIHRCAGHTVEVCPSHRNAGFSLPLLRKDFGRTKIRKFDISHAIKEDV